MPRRGRGHGCCRSLIGDGDVVLVKASNGVGLKRVCETLMRGDAGMIDATPCTHSRPRPGSERR